MTFEPPDTRPRRPDDVDAIVYKSVCAGFSAGTLTRLWGVSTRYLRDCCKRYVHRRAAVTEVDCTAREKHATQHRHHPKTNRLVCLICHPPMPETRKNAVAATPQ